jgi:histone acetyltransferase (RNA polymerase elongator complex component)
MNHHIKKNGPMYSGYTLGKYDFIQNILDKAGFRGTRFVICTHHKEWEVYHRIRKEQIFAPLNIIYDTNHPYLTSHRHYHFILYKGVNIVTVAHVEFFNNNESAIRSLATDTPYKQKGYGKMMIFLLEKWLRLQNKHVIKVHSNLNSENFYRKLGYHDMSFNDQSISKHIVDLGKILPK